MIGRVAAYTSIASLFAYSLAFTAPFAVPKLIVLCLGAMAIAALIVSGDPVDQGRSMIVPGLLLAGVCVMSAMTSAHPALAIVGRYNAYALGLLGLGLAILYNLAASSMIGLGELIPIAGAILGAHAFAQFLGYDAVLTSTRTLGRAISTIGHPVDLGLVLAMCLPFASGRLKYLAVPIALGLFATGSRGAWIAAAAALAVHHKIGLRKALLVLSCVGAVAFAVNRRPFGDSQRMMSWKAALETFQRNPLLGSGPDTFGPEFLAHRPAAFGHETAGNAHNDLLQALATIGALGFCAYVLLLLDAFASVRGPALGAITALFVASKFNPVPLEALVLGAVMCGAYSTRLIRPAPLHPAGRAAIGAFAVVALAIATFVAKADHVARQGDMLSISKACALNPSEPVYRQMLIERGVWEINHTKSPEVIGVISMMLERYGHAKVKL